MKGFTREQKLKKICTDALNLWGLPLQVNVAVEELSELIKELMKFNRYVLVVQNKDEYENVKRNMIATHKEKVAEEIVDVEIMLAQMKIGFEIDADMINDFKNPLIIKFNDIDKILGVRNNKTFGTVFPVEVPNNKAF